MTQKSLNHKRTGKFSDFQEVFDLWSKREGVATIKTLIHYKLKPFKKMSFIICRDSCRLDVLKIAPSLSEKTKIALKNPKSRVTPTSTHDLEIFPFTNSILIILVTTYHDYERCRNL